MANQIRKHITIICSFVLLFTSIVSANFCPGNGGSIENILLNGDFENVFYSPTGLFSGTIGAWSAEKTNLIEFSKVSNFDIDGTGPLAQSSALSVRAGHASVKISQQVELLEDHIYTFSANIASTGILGTNADGGTITAAWLGGEQIAAHSFGPVSSENPQFATLYGQYRPSFSGMQTLTIEISRAFQASFLSPINYIDNIKLDAQIIPAPGAFALGLIGTSVCRWLRKRKLLA